MDDPSSSARLSRRPAYAGGHAELRPRSSRVGRRDSAPLAPAALKEINRPCRTGRAGYKLAALGCLSLTGIDAVPSGNQSAQREELWPGHTLSRVVRQLASRLR